MKVFWLTQRRPEQWSSRSEHVTNYFAFGAIESRDGGLLGQHLIRVKLTLISNIFLCHEQYKARQRQKPWTKGYWAYLVQYKLWKHWSLFCHALVLERVNVVVLHYNFNGHWNLINSLSKYHAGNVFFFCHFSKSPMTNLYVCFLVSLSCHLNPPHPPGDVWRAPKT